MSNYDPHHRDEFEEFLHGFLGPTSEQVSESFWHTLPGEIWRAAYAASDKRSGKTQKTLNKIMDLIAQKENR